MSNAIMTPIGIAVLKAREGVRLKAYQDSVGVWTIGYGSTKGVKKGMVITQAEADARFANDLAGHALPILSAIKVPVSDNEKDALISIAFNIGVSGFTGSTFLRRLNAGDRKGCAEAILWWDKPSAIITRRQAERDQFVTPYSISLPSQTRGSRPVPEPTPADAQFPVTTPITPGGPPTNLWQWISSWFSA